MDPAFGTAGRNFVYVLYTHDRNPLGNPASWGDGCPTPPGATTRRLHGHRQPVPDPVSGDLFYADFEDGEIHRIQWIGGNNPPQAVASANPVAGPAPLNVQVTGSGSSDPDGDAITYAWDLDGDGGHDDATAANPSFTYTTAGTYQVTLRSPTPRTGPCRPPRSRGGSSSTMGVTPTRRSRRPTASPRDRSSPWTTTTRRSLKSSSPRGTPGA